MSQTTPPRPRLPRRPSRAAEAARKAELERIAAMSPTERIALALRLGERRLALEAARRAQTSR